MSATISPCAAHGGSHSVPAGAVAENHAFRVRLAELAALGDWHGPEPSMVMAETRADWRGQWMAQRGTREQWAFWSCVARLSLEHDLADGYTDGVEKARRLVEVYAAAAVHAPTSQWWVLEGRHDPQFRPEDIDTDVYAYVAGPFSTEDEALDRIGDDDHLFSAVPRVPGWSP